MVKMAEHMKAAGSGFLTRSSMKLNHYHKAILLIVISGKTEFQTPLRSANSFDTLVIPLCPISVMVLLIYPVCLPIIFCISVILNFMII